MNNYYFVGYEDFETKEGLKMVKITVLSYKTKTIHSIYKSYTKELITKLDSKYKLFDNCTNDITFVIKRDGKVALDIK